MGEYILEMRNINKSFFGVPVLWDAHIEVKPGEVHVLLGENGAGKSTLMKILSAAYKKESGKIFLDGKETHTSPNYTERDAISDGISIVYQEFNSVPALPIYENIFLGKEPMKGIVVDKAAMIERSRQLMDMIGLKVDPRTTMDRLSVAEQQMVEIVKALSTDVKVLVLDEPTAAITDKETEKLFEIIAQLKANGLGIIYISHRMQELFEIGDRITIMRNGHTIKTLELKNTNVDELTNLMVGKDVVLEHRGRDCIVKDSVALKVEGLCYKDICKDISFELRQGEILGFAGLVGAGRTEMAKCIIGAYKKSAGKVWLDNGTVSLDNTTIKNSIDQGVVYLSENRKEEGVVLIHSVEENILLPNYSKFGKFSINYKAARAFVAEYIQKLRVKVASQKQPVQTLSGGNIQKAVMAKWLATDAKVYIFDEPTRGIDVGSRAEIYDLMEAIVKGGASIIVISSDLVEVMNISDRVAVLHEGELAAILENDENLTQNEILTYAFMGGKTNE